MTKFLTHFTSRGFPLDEGGKPHNYLIRWGIGPEKKKGEEKQPLSYFYFRGLQKFKGKLLETMVSKMSQKGHLNG